MPSAVFWYKIPVINIVYDIIFDETPSHAKLTEMLNNVGLLSALFLTIAMAIPMSVSFDEIQAARQRYSTYPYNGFMTEDRVLRELATFTSGSTYCLGTGVWLTVIILFTTSAGVESEEDTAAHIRDLWWSYTRWIVLVILGSSLLGTIFTFFAFNRMIYIKYPDIYIEQNGRLDFPAIRSSTYGVVLSFTLLYQNVVVGLCVALVSYSKYRIANAITTKVMPKQTNRLSLHTQVVTS